eukprot:1194047-Prorocentrum_minimum.AAC.4
MKRDREEGEEEPAAPPVGGVVDDDDDDKPVGIRYRSVSSVRPGYECPYMDTICRQVGVLLLMSGALSIRPLCSNVCFRKQQ